MHEIIYLLWFFIGIIMGILSTIFIDIWLKWKEEEQNG